MSKTNEQLLNDFKKSNKQRRVKIVQNAGFTTEAQYLASLTSGKLFAPTGKKNASSKKKQGPIPTIHNVHILDASGSMAGPKLRNAIAGINGEITELQRDTTANYTQTIVDFSYPYDIVTHMYKVPIASCKTFNTRDRGTTALNQAVGETLQRLLADNKNDEKVLVKIFTDGGENNSTGTFKDPKNLSELIKECEGKGFTVTFVGTENDVKIVVRDLGIFASNTLTHDNTARGVQASYTASAGATMSYAKKVLRKESVTENFFSKKVGKL